MKILLVNKFFYNKGGAEKVFFKERNFLLENGFDVIDFSMKDHKNKYSPFSEYFVPNINYRKKENIWKNIERIFSFIHSSVAVNNIRRLIIKERPDIAHLHNIYHQLTPSIIPILKKYNVKIVLTLHDYKVVCPNYVALNQGNLCHSCEENYFWNLCIKNCHGTRSFGFLLFLEAFYHKFQKSYDAIDYFISPSKFLANICKSRIPSEKIIVIPNGIDLNKYHPNYSDNKYGLYFGRLSQEKGVRTLLKAHKRMNTSYPLKIAGSGHLFDKLSTKYPKVQFVGYQNAKNLHSLISKSSYVIVPSEWFENFSMTVLEAMALGKPIIGSCIGGIPEQVEDGENGFLFKMGNVDELANKMDILSTNPELRFKMGHSARNRVETNYSFNNHFSRLTQLYSELLNRDINKSVFT